MSKFKDSVFLTMVYNLHFIFQFLKTHSVLDKTYKNVQLLSQITLQIRLEPVKIPLSYLNSGVEHHLLWTIEDSYFLITIFWNSTTYVNIKSNTTLYLKTWFGQNSREWCLGPSLTTNLKVTFYKTHTHIPNCLPNFTAVSFPQYCKKYQTNRRQYD